MSRTNGRFDSGPYLYEKSNKDTHEPNNNTWWWQTNDDQQSI